MGEYSVFECRKCGYKSKQIRWGVGQDDPRFRFLPAHCSQCREIVEVDLTGHDVLIDTFTHSECGTQVLFFQKDQSYACPKCNAPDVRILQKGYW